jgi:hypothetical protein
MAPLHQQVVARRYATFVETEAKLVLTIHRAGLEDAVEVWRKFLDDRMRTAGLEALPETFEDDVAAKIDTLAAAPIEQLLAA